MELTRVESSNIEAIGYDEARRTLRIKFKSGQSFDYLGVPIGIYREMMGAESKGKYLTAHVKGRFNSQKLDAVAYCRTCSDWTAIGHRKVEERREVGRCSCDRSEHFDKERLETDTACKKYRRDPARIVADAGKIEILR